MPASKSAKPVQSASKAAAKTETKAPAATAPKSKAAQLKEAADALLAAAEAPAKKEAWPAGQSSRRRIRRSCQSHYRRQARPQAQGRGCRAQRSTTWTCRILKRIWWVSPNPQQPPGEKVKPLRMKISKAKERALMKEFGLDETVLSEEDMAKRRAAPEGPDHAGQDPRLPDPRRNL